MRYILFILFNIGFLLTAICQENDRPTQKQIETQKQEAISKAKKTKEETIKKLAEAKANNEDAEKIKQIESRLASLDQMISMLEKTNLTGNSNPKILPKSDIQEPTYVSPFTPIKLTKPVSAPTWDQAKDKLLWYNGRRIDANTLITPSGLIARYDRQRATVILQPPRPGPGPDTIYYGLVNTLAQTKRLKDDFSIRMDNMLNSFFMFPEIENGYKEFDFFKENYYELAKNTITLETAQPDANLETKIQNFIDYVTFLPADRVILPPERPNDLCFCNDPTAKQSYHESMDQWMNKFYAEEFKIIQMLQDIFRHVDFAQSHNVNPSLPPDITDPTGFGIIIFNRMKRKLQGLVEKYEQGNILLEDGMVLALLNLLKKVQDFDEHKAPQFKNVRSEIVDLFAKIKRLMDSNIFETYIEKQKADININRVFDYGLYVSHELNRKMVNPESEVNQTVFQKWLEGLKKFNRFKLSIDLDFKYQISAETGEATMWATGFLKNDVDMYVSLGKRDCKWILFLTEVNHRNLTSSGEEFKIPMRVVNGEKDYINDKKPPFPYSGPRVMKMVFPTFKINFCGDGSEVLMDVLSFSSADAKSHENDDPKAGYTTDIMAFANKMLLGIKKTEVNVSKLISIAGDMMNMTSIGNSQMSQSSGNPALDRMKTEYEMNKQRMDLQDRLAQTSHKDKTVIPLSGYAPGSSLLFSPTYDMVDEADEDRKMGIMLTKAILKLKVEHAPR